MTDIAGFRQINEMVEKEARFVHALLAEIRKAIVGQESHEGCAPQGGPADGHILLEGILVQC